ncbi:hypothetical protein [Bradyrhizobium sp. MOS003]|uniref:hypothetical protein n=1 Tax=Bradyrhizobium sp. MOS003 TaxID=2133946 RepID=UPI000D134C45|nr:hypothetical protein [Bradyrhizobium sp. MOS003]PSO14262.1 hypothetical protein C7G42_32570 [Bradyrhizobium sp. MOS003]
MSKKAGRPKLIGPQIARLGFLKDTMFSGLAGKPLPCQHPIADALSPDPARRYSSLLRIRALPAK